MCYTDKQHKDARCVTKEHGQTTHGHTYTTEQHTMCYSTKIHNMWQKNAGKQHKDLQCVKYGHTTTHNVLHRNTADTHWTNSIWSHGHTDFSRTKAIAIVAIFICWHYLNPILRLVQELCCVYSSEMLSVNFAQIAKIKIQTQATRVQGVFHSTIDKYANSKSADNL